MAIKCLEDPEFVSVVATDLAKLSTRLRDSRALLVKFEQSNGIKSEPDMDGTIKQSADGTVTIKLTYKRSVPIEEW